MRDIQTELEQWDSDAPTYWEPNAGDILIGIVKGYSSQGSGESETLTIQEEETGLLVAVPLDSPDLVNLIKLQRPHTGERIGIKYLHPQTDNGASFVLMVDRAAQQPEANANQPAADSPQLPDLRDVIDPVDAVADSSELPDLRDVIDPLSSEEMEGTTDEERSFIENALLEEPAVPDPPAFQQPSMIYSDGMLREIIRRQDEHIAQQAENIRELEGILASAIPLLCSGSEPAPPAPTETEQSLPNDGFGRFRIAITIVSSMSLALAGYLAYVLLWART